MMKSLPVQCNYVWCIRSVQAVPTAPSSPALWQFLRCEGDTIYLFGPTRPSDTHRLGNQVCCTLWWLQSPSHPCWENARSNGLSRPKRTFLSANRKYLSSEHRVLIWAMTGSIQRWYSSSRRCLCHFSSLLVNDPGFKMGSSPSGLHA